MNTTDKFLATLRGMNGKYRTDFGKRFIHDKDSGKHFNGEYFSVAYVSPTGKHVRLKYQHDPQYKVEFFSLKINRRNT